MANIICGIISGLLASFIYAIIVSNITFGYRNKVKVILYELHGQLALLENGIEYHNENIMYSSMNMIWNGCKEVIDLSRKIVFCNKKLVMVINTFAAQCISLLIFIGQSERGFNVEQEKEARINSIISAFFYSDNQRIFSDFALELVWILNNKKYTKFDANNVHILDNTTHIDFWKDVNDIELCKSNEEIINILNNI